MKNYLLLLAIMFAAPAVSSDIEDEKKVSESSPDETTVSATATEALNANEVTKKKSFGKTLTAPIRWIGKNWTAYDPKYSLPSFYNWAAQIQNTTSC